MSDERKIRGWNSVQYSIGDDLAQINLECGHTIKWYLQKNEKGCTAIPHRDTKFPCPQCSRSVT